jgi:hypothetical protein
LSTWLVSVAPAWTKARFPDAIALRTPLAALTGAAGCAHAGGVAAPRKVPGAHLGKAEGVGSGDILGNGPLRGAVDGHNVAAGGIVRVLPGELHEEESKRVFVRRSTAHRWGATLLRSGKTSLIGAVVPGFRAVLFVAAVSLTTQFALALPPGVKSGSDCPSSSPGTQDCVSQGGKDAARGLPHVHIVMCDDKGNMCCIQTSDGIYKCKRISNISVPLGGGTPTVPSAGEAH